jgi:hypothetical protein
MALKPENWEPELESRDGARTAAIRSPRSDIDVSTLHSSDTGPGGIHHESDPARSGKWRKPLGPSFFLHDGTGGLIAGVLVFFALGVVLAKVGQRKLQ